MNSNSITPQEVAESCRRIDRFYPSTDQKYAGIDIRYFYQAASALAGDYFYVTELLDSSMFVCILDAEGHGLPAAMQVRLLLDTIHNPFWQALAPTDAMIEIERIVSLSRVLQDEYAAFPLAIFHISAKRDEFTYANAGMPFPKIIRQGSVVDVPRATGWKIGRDYAQHNNGMVTVPLQENDVLIIASDGIYETLGRRRSSFRSILESWREDTITAESVIAMISDSQYGDRPETPKCGYDQSLLAIQCKGSVAPSVWSHSVIKADDTYEYLHERVRPDALNWMAREGISEARANSVWMASWEAILNGLKHGTQLGHQCIFGFRHQADDLELWVLQEHVWQDWEQHLRSIQAERQSVPFPIICGTRIMARLADEFTVDGFGSRMRLRFSIS